tara:strand:- start:185 stop:748 length:564 start_codon:yes stop_codon:yes gene_type:complete
MAIHTLVLIRHGEASASWGEHIDPGLSNDGKKQAEKLIETFSEENLENFKFISSPKLRAVETGQPLAMYYNKDLKIQNEFSEIPSEKISNDKKQNWLREVMSQDINTLPEEIKSWQDNIMNALSSINSDAVIFSHFMVINAIAASVLRNSKLLYFYPDYTSCTRLLVKDNQIKQIILGNDKKTLINL